MKKIFLLILLILLTGCTAEVNINISPDTINEQVIITAYKNQNFSKEQIYSGFRKYVPAFYNDYIPDAEPDIKKEGVEYYYRSETDLGNGYSFFYNYSFNYGNYKNARTVKDGFKSFVIQKDVVEKHILLTTDNGGNLYFNQYPELESIKINITSSYSVKESNADYVNGNVYTWIMYPNSKKSVYLLLDYPVSDDINNSNGKDEIKEDNNDNEDNDLDKNQVYSKKSDESDFSKFVNENPVLMVVVVFLGFLIIVLLVSKFSKF